MIPDSFKQDLLNRVDIVDVVSRHVQLKKAGANHLGLCPFHGEKTPSFSVSPAKQFYHCFGCGAHGNAIGFLMAYAGMGYIDAVKDLAASVGMQVPEERPASPHEAARKERETDLYAVMEQAMDFYRGALKKTPRAIDYLKGRGLTGEVAARFRVGYAPEGWQPLKSFFQNYEDKALVEAGLVVEAEGKRYDRFRDRIMFPILNARGAVIGFGGRIIADGEPKYMNSPETPLFEKGREVYGLVQARDAIRAAGRALVVEGYMDVVALAQYGIGYSVATLGTATTPVHVSKLLRLADDLVFCFDGDAAGRKAAWRALEVSLALAPDHKPIRFLFLPESDDPDSYVRRHGKEGFENLLARSQTLSEFLLGELRSQSQLDTAEGRARFLSLAKPYVQKLAAPALRIQVINAVAELGRISDQEVRQLMEVAPVERFRRAAPARPRAMSNSSPEWSLLYSLLIDLPMVVHLEPALLRAQHPETRALLAIRELVGTAEDEPSVGALLERLEGNPALELVLQASRYGDELGFTQEDARGEIQAALAKLDVLRRGVELDAILGQGLRSREDQLAYQRKLMDFKRLQGALRPENREQA